MQIENDYEKEVFNGEVGRISGIDLEGQGVTSEDSQTRTVFLAERTLAIQEMIDYPLGWRDLNP
jgi:ATP-dependent exoDNAse (exonuclease V) alpha subunit